MCQDTGTAIVKAKKGQFVLTGGGDEAVIAAGVQQTYLTSNLRYSQIAPLTMYDESNTGTNLPAEIKISAVDGDAYKFLFIAKGGGSANKSYLFQETKALLNEETLLPWLFEKMQTLGTAACPPYHLAVVIGGTSAEVAMKTGKLASHRLPRPLPTSGSPAGHAFRDPELEGEGARAVAADRHRRAVRRQVLLPRRAGDPPPPPRRQLPGRIGVSCSADRQALKARSPATACWLEQLERDPARFLPRTSHRRAPRRRRTACTST